MITLPPIGAKIRTTATHPDGSTVTIEGVVTAHPDPVITLRNYVIVGEGDGVVAYVEDFNKATVAVEVLESPLPAEWPNRTVLHDGNATWERDDTAAEVGGRGDAHWWYAPDGDRVSYTYAEMLRTARQLTRLVPDPAADAPTLPWEHTDGAGDTVTVEAPSPERATINIPGGDYVNLSRDKARELAGALLRWAGGAQ